MLKLFNSIGRGLRDIFIAISAIAIVGSGIAIGDYAATQGSGTNFGSLIISATHFAATVVCDITTYEQCQSVNSNHSALIDANTSSQIHADLTASIPAGNNGIGNVGVTTISAGTNVIGYISNDPCAQQTKTNFAFATTVSNLQIISGVTGKKVYICNIMAFISPASNLSILEGSGAQCVNSNSAAVVGSTTNASGMNIAANGGLTYGNGSGTVIQTISSGNGLCFQQSSPGPGLLSGNLGYLQQ